MNTRTTVAIGTTAAAWFNSRVDIPGINIPTTIAYHVDDPYAVHVTFNPTTGPNTWVFSRDLLLTALGATWPVGDGDIMLASSHGQVWLQMSPPDGRMLASLPQARVSRLLARSCHLVPFGSEPTHVDIDSLIARLLQGAS